MNRAQLVSAVAEKAGETATKTDAILRAFQEVVTGAVGEGDKVSISGFITVERTKRAERQGRNPRTNETIVIPAGFGVKVTAGSALKAAVKE